MTISRLAFTCALLAICLNVVPAATKPVIPPPRIPDKTFKITDYGAAPDGTTLNTAAIQKTIAAASAAGGGTVEIPPGKFLTGALDLVSKINLKIDEGATLLFTDSADAFPITDNRHHAAILADKCTDIAITGKGTIDGQGKRWWEAFRKIKGTPDEKKHTRRPNLIDLSDCQRVLIEDVLLTNSPMFHLVPRDCDDVVIQRVRFNSPANAPNTDGIDPSGHNYHITQCLIDVGDDNIAFKPQRPRKDGSPSCQNMLVTDCVFKHGHGLSIGGQTPAGMRDLVVRNCSFEDTDAGIRMKAPRGEGGLVENLQYDNISMRRVKVGIFITCYYPNSTTPKDPGNDQAKPVTATTPIWRNIRINNLAADDCEEAGRIFGLPESPVTDLKLQNVVIKSDKGLQIANAKGVEMVNCVITAAKGPPVIAKNAQGSGLPNSD